MPCLMLRSTSSNGYMFRSTCFLLFHSSLCSMLMLGLHVHTCLYMLLAMFCSDLCVYVLFAMFMLRSTFVHEYVLGFMSYHVYVLDFYMFTCMFLCLYVSIYVFTCSCAWIYVLYMFHAIFHVLVFSMPCLCA